MHTLSPCRHCERSEAIQTAPADAFLDCFAEAGIVLRDARTRRLAMTEQTVIRHPEVAAHAALEGRRPGSFILRGSLREHLRMTRSRIAEQN
jgi:hypothetical protein